MYLEKGEFILTVASYDHNLLHECEWGKFEVVMVHTNDLVPLPTHCEETRPRLVEASIESSTQENPKYESTDNGEEGGDEDVDDGVIVERLNSWFFSYKRSNDAGDSNEDGGANNTTTASVPTSITTTANTNTTTTNNNTTTTVTNEYKVIFNASDPFAQQQLLDHYNTHRTRLSGT